MAPHLDFAGRLVRGQTKFLATQFLSLAILVAVAPAQETTLARLTHESSAPLSSISSTSTWNAPHRSPHSRSARLPETAFSRSAANALFVHSSLDRARTLSTQALRHNPKDTEALFVRMEVAAMEADTAATLDAAIRLCEAGETSPRDPRVQLAAARIRQAAGNTPQFRLAIPRIKTMLANSQQPWPDLHAALLQAAMDGTPNLDPYAISRAAGILTDWRILGPLEQRPLAPDDSISNADDLSHNFYENRAVENFQFPDGRIVLPDYLSHHGAFYAASHFGSLTNGTWQVTAEGAASLEIFVDGKPVLMAANTAGLRRNTFEAASGPHRVLVKFTRAATPLRVTITAQEAQPRSPLSPGLSEQELAYRLAANHYANGEFDDAARQVDAVPASQTSAALEFLLAESLRQETPRSLTAWGQLHALAPASLAADNALATRALKDHDPATALRLADQVLSAYPSNAAALETAARAQQASAQPEASEADLWARLVNAHPSCKTLLNAIAFYRGRGEAAAADATLPKLNGCAPESLDYARALSQQGSHAQAARALQQLLAAAPFNRAARLMLVRELQLAGEDRQAQRAAAEWLHIAPNAERYHRLATAVSDEESAGEADVPFYAPYRRSASTIVEGFDSEASSAAAVELLDDHVAIARPDGSVSLYVHTVTRLGSEEPSRQLAALMPPQSAEALMFRVHRADGSTADLPDAAQSPVAGDIVESEYVIHYAGDGGIPEHPEAFQFVFGSFGESVLNSRFVVLTPAEQADRGTVIATGGAPVMSEKVINGMLQRVWTSDNQDETSDSLAGASHNGLPIVRVVEQENGWSVPSSAEHQRRIETIHPGPRPEDS